MANEYRVIFSERAVAQLEKINQYLLEFFGETTVDRAIDAFLALIQRLRRQPDMYAYYDKKRGLRRALLRSRMWVIYKIEHQTVTITAVYSTYQNIASEDLT